MLQKLARICVLKDVCVLLLKQPIVDAILRSGETPFQNLAPLDGKHFCPFVELFFGILRSVAESLRFLKVSWNAFVRMDYKCIVEQSNEEI